MRNIFFLILTTSFFGIYGQVASFEDSLDVLFKKRDYHSIKKEYYKEINTRNVFTNRERFYVGISMFKTQQKTGAAMILKDLEKSNDLSKKEINTVIKINNKLAKKDYQECYQIFFKTLALVQNDQYISAERKMDECLKIDDNFFLANFLMFLLKLELNKIDEAVYYYNKLYSENPYNVKAIVAMAKLQYKNKSNVEESLNTLKSLKNVSNSIYLYETAFFFEACQLP